MDGQREGEWVIYWKQAVVAEKGQYNSGNKVGVWEYYLEDGRLNQKIEYTNGKKQVLLDNHLLPPVPKN
ncbi:hypothetical protein D3C72_2282390 [compost metagenome]